MAPYEHGRLTRNTKYSLPPNQCFDTALKALTKNIPISTQGKCNARALLSTFIGMAVGKQSCHSIQKQVSNVPSETSIRHHLRKFNIDQLEEVNHTILVDFLEEMIPKERGYEFSIDLTDDPYYGSITPENEDYIVKGPTKKSTKTFYRYATLYMTHRQIKITLAVLPVKKGTKHIEYVKRFIELIEEMGLKIKVLLLDRGFFSVSMIRYLMGMNIPHIMPVKNVSNEMMRILAVKKVRFEPYTVTSPKDGSVDVTVAIDVHYLKGKFKRHGAVTYGYVVYGIDWNPRKIYRTYRRRFAIESSYRMRNKVRPRTSSKNPTFRYLLAIISFLLKNVWMLFKWKFFARMKRGPKVIEDDHFRFDRFILSMVLVFHRRAKAIVDIRTIRPCR